MKRKLLLVTGGLLLLVICSAVAILLLVDVNVFRPTIQAELQKQLRRPVTLGKLSLSLFPLAIRVDGSSIAERPDLPAGSRAFIRMQSLEVRTSLAALLRREIQVDSVVLRKPEIELVKSATSEWNFADLTKAKSSTAGPTVNLTEVRVEDGAIAINDGFKRTVYNHVNVTLRDLAPGLRTSIVASLQVPGSGTDALRLEAKMNPREGRLTMKDLSLAGLLSATGNTGATPADGSLSGAIDVKPDSASGRIELQKASLNGKPLNLPAALDFALAITADQIRANKLTLTAGKLTATGAGTLNTKHSTLDLQARLAATSLEELLSLARITGNSVRGFEGSGIVSLDLTARGPLTSLALGGQGSLRDAELRGAAIQAPLKVRASDFSFDRNTVRLQNVDAAFAGSNLKGWLQATGLAGTAQEATFDLDVDRIDGAEWQKATTSTQPAASASPSRLRARGNIRVGHLLTQGLVLDNVRTEATLDNGVLRLDPLTAELFGGRESGGIVVDTRPKVPTVELRTKFEGVDANKLLSATTSVKQVITGLLLAGADARISLAATPAEMARSLNGALTMKLTKGQLKGTNILNQLSAIGRFAGYGDAAKPFTDIVQLDGDLNVVDGLARTENLRMQIDGATLGMTGLVSLVDQTLNLKVTAVLDREMSRRVGGTGIGGYLNTALANSQGELVIPALVTGTLENPKFAPDAARMAEMKMKQLLPSASNPLGVLGAIQGG
ncbi:MAG: AsmA family protein, partial [Bryobacteraceae bacterium]|nr:AsmA family protein [Bryobacteraceae bacterium]